jgi:hypothetical protein
VAYKVSQIVSAFASASLKLIETRFGLTPLTDRATPLAKCEAERK